MTAYGDERHTCCVLGHREIVETPELVAQLRKTMEYLILEQGVDTFLFGSKSRFNSLCYALATEIQGKYTHIRRIYVRGEFPVIDEDYHRYLLERYEDTQYPQALAGAGRSVYVIRNRIMIDSSHFCLFYCREDYMPIGRKSGTRQALAYAEKHNKIIYRFP